MLLLNISITRFQRLKFHCNTCRHRLHVDKITISSKTDRKLHTSPYSPYCTPDYEFADMIYSQELTQDIQRPPAPVQQNTSENGNLLPVAKETICRLTGGDAEIVTPPNSVNGIVFAHVHRFGGKPRNKKNHQR